MAKVIYTKKPRSPYDESLIPNKQIEQMFLSIADDDMMQNYNKLVNDGHIALASAYASQRVFKVFNYFRDGFIKQQGDIEYLVYMLFKRK